MQTDGKRPNKQPLDGKIREVLAVLRHALGELYGDRMRSRSQVSRKRIAMKRSR